MSAALIDAIIGASRARKEKYLWLSGLLMLMGLAPLFLSLVKWSTGVDLAGKLTKAVASLL
jgi:hypothetical protein